jgi:probable addiction module antidote protein
MAIATDPWDPAESLNTPGDIAAYLDTYLEDGTPEELRHALGVIARRHGYQRSHAKPEAE